MQTEIIKKISPKKMVELFDNTDLVNIRLFTAVGRPIIYEGDEDVKINYRIIVRHNEDENPTDLLTNAIKKL